jgi:hypothetical protein
MLYRPMRSFKPAICAYRCGMEYAAKGPAECDELIHDLARSLNRECAAPVIKTFVDGSVSSIDRNCVGTGEDNVFDKERCYGKGRLNPASIPEIPADVLPDVGNSVSYDFFHDILNAFFEGAFSQSVNKSRPFRESEICRECDHWVSCYSLEEMPSG